MANTNHLYLNGRKLDTSERKFRKCTSFKEVLDICFENLDFISIQESDSSITISGVDYKKVNTVLTGYINIHLIKKICYKIFKFCEIFDYFDEVITTYTNSNLYIYGYDEIKESGEVNNGVSDYIEFYFNNCQTPYYKITVIKLK